VPQAPPARPPDGWSSALPAVYDPTATANGPTPWSVCDREPGRRPAARAAAQTIAATLIADTNNIKAAQHTIMTAISLPTTGRWDRQPPYPATIGHRMRRPISLVVYPPSSVTDAWNRSD